MIDSCVITTILAICTCIQLLLRMCLYLTFVLKYIGDLYPQPYPGQVRLVGGEVPSEGRLEVYFSGQWGAVCGEGTVDGNVATTVCKQLGYPMGSVRTAR